MHRRAVSWLILLVAGILAASPAAAIERVDRMEGEALAGRLRIQVRDEAYALTQARVSVLDPGTGEPYWPDDPEIETYQAYTGHRYFFLDGQTDIAVPNGPVRVIASRGPEYEVVDQTVYVSGFSPINIVLPRLFDLPSEGWYSGDTHVHIAHGGEGSVYTLTNEDLALAARAEDLHVVCALTNGLFFNGGLDPAGDADHLLHFGVEYRSALYGHMDVIGLTSLIPYGCCLPGSPSVPLNMDVQDLAHAQGATVCYAHPVSMDPELLMDDSGAWPASGLAREIPVDVLLGKVDVYDLYAYSNSLQETAHDLWFGLLDLGVRLPLSAGTDAAMDRYFDPPPGGYRVFVQVDGPLTFEAWREGLEAGRSFASNGPLPVSFSVEGVEPGGNLTLTTEDPTSVSGHLRLYSRTPATELRVYSSNYGYQRFYLPAYDGVLEYDFDLWLPARCRWIVARVLGPAGTAADIGNTLEATTSPIYVETTESKAPVMFPRAVQRFDAWISDLQTLVVNRDGWESEGQMIGVWNRIERARQLMWSRGSTEEHRDDFARAYENTAGTIHLEAGTRGERLRAEGSGTAQLEVFDVAGRLRHVSDPRTLPAEFRWDAHAGAADLPAGIYFARIRSGRKLSSTVRLLRLP